MTKCYQCEKPALWQIVTENEARVPLCLGCYKLFHDMQNMDFLKSAIMYNQALEEMDLVTGFHTPGGRMPVSNMVKAMQKAPILNNIQVSNSQIGVLNTGSIEKIDASITLSRDSDVENLSHIIKSLSEKIIQSREIDDREKNESLELIAALSEELIRSRRKSILSAIISELAKRFSEVASIAKSVDELISAVGPLVS